MTDLGDAARAERLRRLAEHRGAGRAAAAPATDLAEPPPRRAPSPATGRTASVAPAGTPPERRKRRHAAPAARVLAAGLSGSSFLFGVAALAAQPAGPPKTAAGSGSNRAPSPLPTEPVTPVTVVVVERVHRPVFVDQHGNPVDPARLAPGSAPPAAPLPAQAKSATAGLASGGPAPRPGTVPAATTPVAPTASPAAAPPSGSTGRTAPAGSATPPVVVPTTVTTTAPPPPPPPPCSGSKCP